MLTQRLMVISKGARRKESHGKSITGFNPDRLSRLKKFCFLAFVLPNFEKKIKTGLPNKNNSSHRTFH
jgi:hypothetical protein